MISSGKRLCRALQKKRKRIKKNSSDEEDEDGENDEDKKTNSKPPQYSVITSMRFPIHLFAIEICRKGGIEEREDPD